MKKYALFGNPIKHSLSPKIYNHLFEHFGIEATYELFETNEFKKKDIEQFDGINVTYPFKKEALNFCKANKITSSIGAINTLIKREDGLKGINTDGIGFLNSILDLTDINSILILGAGATSKAATLSLKNGPFFLAVLNRSSIPLLDNIFEDVLTYTPSTYNKEFKPDLVVNMTSIGLDNDELPFKEDIEEIIKNSSICIDINYSKKTSFLKLCKERNKKVINGKELLKEQAIFSFLIFTEFAFSYEEVKKALKELEL